MSLDEKVIEISGRDGACWASFSSSFHEKGTVSELKDYFLSHVNTGYTVFSDDSEHGTEMVSPEFFQEVGKYLIETLEYEDLIGMTSTLETINKHHRDCGYPTFDKHNTLYHTYGLIESEEFKQASPEERLGLFADVQTKYESFSREAIMSSAFWTVASSFMDMGTFHLEKKYPSLKEGIQDIWEKEACEKSIFPYLDKIAEKID
tara:strand:+ start:5186 stop:5800 length:615 start_codon:yes stop_codon:yes gene_type:complete